MMEEGRDYTEYRDYQGEELDKEIGRGILIVGFLLIVLWILYEVAR